MKVLILANNDVGLYKFRKELLSELLVPGSFIENRMAEPCEVYISLPNGEYISELVSIGCRFIETPLERRGINPFVDIKLIFTYLNLLRRLKPDMVITYTIKPNVYGGGVSRLYRIPYAVNITGLGTVFQKEGLLKESVIKLYRCALKKAKVVFFENEDNLNTFVSRRILPREKCKLLNGAGVNLDYFPYTEYPVEDAIIRFLFVGRMMREKGIDELFTAIRELRGEGQKCVLDVVGPYEEDYKMVIKNYEQEGWLFYHGYQQDVRPFIKQAHCFVLPSWHEGMANTNLECASTGRPIITSNIHGCKEAVIENKSGFLCEPKNAISLRESMHRFLSLSHEQRIIMGQEGRRHVEMFFDKKKVVEETIRELD